MLERLSIVTALWGDWHIENFRTLVMPALRHASNLPALAKRFECSWRIHTRDADVERVTALVSPMIGYMPTDVTTEAGGHYKDAWQFEHKRAAKSGALAMFLPPDVVWSIGSFAHIANLLEVGVRTIYTAHPRAKPSEVYAEPQHAEDLMQHVIADKHPINTSHEFESKHFTCHPEMIIWSVKGAQVVRLLAREMFVCDPREVKFNDNNLPHAIGSGPYVVRKSDDALGVSLAPEKHDEDNYNGVERMCSAETVAPWVKSYASPANRWIASQPVVWRHGEVDREELELMIENSRNYAEDIFMHAAL